MKTSFITSLVMVAAVAVANEGEQENYLGRLLTTLPVGSGNQSE